MFAKKELLSNMKKNTERIFSQELASDVTVHVDGASFSLHKFPLFSKCGYFRKLVSKSGATDLSLIEIVDIPGGAESFELAAKFCYGIKFEISVENIAMLRCVSEFLEMTEENCIGNLIARTEAYLDEVALKTLHGAISVLQSSQSLLPLAEKVRLVNRCIDSIAYIASKDGHFQNLGRVENGLSNGANVLSSNHLKPVLDRWDQALTLLRIDFFQRVVVAMIARGIKQYELASLLMLYAQKSLHDLEKFGNEKAGIEIANEHEKRVVLETISSFLPKEKNAIPVSFLSMMLRAAIRVETTVACRLDLEKRIGLQLAEAVLDDLLIPSFTGNTILDVDAVYRIMTSFLENETGSRVSPHNEIVQIGKLMESYLAEIALDQNLSVVKFVNVAEMIPERAKMDEDGIYRAVDIYLKVHPNLSEIEKKNICSVMNIQKMSQEACSHAAKNSRLPVQTVIQVLYYEQQQLSEATDLKESESPTRRSTREVYSSDIHPIPNDVCSLQRENQVLRVELLKMKMKLKELENLKDEISSPLVMRPSLRRRSFFSSVSKRIGQLYQIGRYGITIGRDGVTPPSTKRSNTIRRVRRHSIS